MDSSLAIVTVVYNNYTILNDFFASLNNQTATTFRVYIADVSSHPQEYPYPAYATHFRTANKGYAHGVNEAIKKAHKDGHNKFAVINCDVIVANTFVEKTLASLSAHPKSVIGGKIYYAKGFEFHADRYLPEELGKVLWYAGGTIDWANVYTSHVGVDEVDDGTYDQERETDFVTGCFMAYDESVREATGNWDERYFLYFEDTDFCIRAQRAGVGLLFDPSIVLWHKNAQSTDGSGSALHVKFQNRNRVRFALSYAPLRAKLHVLKNEILALLTR